jgi:hypothetical protein
MTDRGNNLEYTNTPSVYACAYCLHLYADNIHQNDAGLNLANGEVTSDDFPTDNSENVDNFEKISIPELQRRYNIKRDSLYKRMAHLQIRPWKVSGHACLDAQQVRSMDKLHDYIRSNKRMESYPKPKPSGPKHELKEATEAITDYVSL